VKNFSSEELWSLSRHVLCLEVGVSSKLFCLIHSALNPLERVLCLGMAVLVRVKLLRQFAVKLGELSGLHVLHARHQDVNRGV
jgi:hypothetical protein